MKKIILLALLLASVSDAQVSPQYFFIDSLTKTGANVSLVGDSATPGNFKFYATNGSGTRAWYDQSAIAFHFVSANTARVDPSGDDSTGTVGDTTKPFLTCQAALTALENQGGFTTNSPAILELPPVDSTENVTTSLQHLVIFGKGITSFGLNPAIGQLTLTNDGSTGPDTGVHLGLTNVWVNATTAANVIPGAALDITATNAILRGDVTTTGALYVNGVYNSAAAYGTLSPGSGLFLFVRGLKSSQQDQNFPTINAPGSSVQIIDSYIDTVTAAGSISIQDSVINTNNSGITPSRNDFFTNPALMDFSTLPTTDPVDNVHAWNDNGFVVVSGSGNPKFPHSVTLNVDGGGIVLGTGTKNPTTLSYGFTVTNWKVICKPSCSATVDILRAANGAGLPVTSIIGGGTKPSVTSAVENTGVPTGWTSTVLTQEDNVAVSLSGVTAATYLQLILFGK